jgi:ATP-binding cassette, subfamily B, bacterial MsbA
VRALFHSSRELSWRRLLAYLRPYRWWMAAAIGAMLFATAVGLILPLAVGRLVNAITGDATFPLNQVVFGLLIVAVLQALFSLVQTYALSFVGERVVSDLRIQAFSHLQRLSLSFFSNRRTGEITSRITNDVALIQTALTSNVATLLQSLVQFVGALVLMLIVSWQLSMLALVLVPTVTALGVVFGRWLRRLSTQVQDRLAESAAVLEESTTGVRVVQSFAREPYEIDRFTGAIEATFQMALRRARVRAIFQPLIALVAWATMAGVLYMGARLVLSGVMQAGDLVAFMLYAGTIGGTLGAFAGLFGQIQEALGAITRVFELLDTPPEIVDRPDAIVLSTVAGRVTLQDVTFAYDRGADERPTTNDERLNSSLPELLVAPDHASSFAFRPSSVLKGITLDIAPGEVLALVGPSGAGKSTIANLIPRFYDVSSGRVCIDGHDVRDVTLASLRAQIGIVPQETQLFSGSVRENIRYGRLNATDAELEAAAQAANAHDFILALPDGYATNVGERGVKLSGGQRQRVAIARAILKDPRILILDEATSALDTESEGLVQEALERLMRDRTSIIIAHRLSTIRRADRIAVIVDGAIVELGSHAELLAAGGRYARLYSMQFRDEDRELLALAHDIH